VAVAAEIASRPGRTLFFVRTKHGADRLVKQLTRAGIEAAAIHGDRNQNQRQRALDAFAAGHPRVLVATDVAARGIHVDDVDLVVQFDPPNDHKDYLHRSGRTARAGASGMVIALVERGQLRELRRLHDAAGVTAASDEVAAGHHVVRQIAASGTPVPPAPVRPARERPASERPASERKGAARGHSRRRGSGQRSADSATGDRGGSPSRTGSSSRAGSSSRTGGASRMVAADRTGSSSRAGGGARTGSGRRAARVAAVGREDAGRSFARDTARGAAQGAADSGRRSQSAHRSHQARGNQYAAKSA
jgi:superfamily II DNA/RNA helicase